MAFIHAEGIASANGCCETSRALLQPYKAPGKTYIY